MAGNQSVSSWKTLAWALPLTGLMVLTSQSARAEEMTLKAAIARTLSQHPSLRAQDFAATAITRQGELDSLAPALSWGADLENVLGTGELSGIGSAEATLKLSRVFELGGKRAARQARGRADVDQAGNARSQQQLELTAETTRRYLMLAHSKQVLALARDQLRLAQQTEAAVQQRVQRSVAPEADAALARIAVLRAELADTQAAQSLASARFALAALWGTGSAEVEAHMEWQHLPELPADFAFEPLAARLPRTPEALAYTRQADQLTADRALAKAAARSDVTVDLGLRRIEAVNDQALTLSFSMPFGSAARTRSGLALARNEAQVQRLQAMQTAAELDARQQLFAQLQTLAQARAEFAAIDTKMLPAAEQALSLTKTGFNAARYSLLQLNQAQATLLQLRRERLAAALLYHQTLAEIERTTAIAATGVQAP